MAYLTLTDEWGTSVDVKVLADTFVEEPAATVGERYRMANGRLASSVVAEKRRWSFDGDPRMTTAERDALEALIGADKLLTATGTAMRASTQVIVRRTSDTHQFIAVGNSAHRHFLRFEMEEV